MQQPASHAHARRPPTLPPHTQTHTPNAKQVFTTSASPNFSQPWTYLSQTKCTASGFAISPLSKRLLLTNAHAVAQQVRGSSRAI
jgi:hypothetical protein